jgi:hypothetical protein
MSTPATATWDIDLKIGDVSVDSTSIGRFEYKALVNGGYIVWCKLIDFHFNFLDTVIEKGQVLKQARQLDNPIVIEFGMKWRDGEDDQKMEKRAAIMSDFYANGSGERGGFFEFVAIDPVSYFINSGDGAGSVYKGKIGGEDGVISEVIKDYAEEGLNYASFNLKKEIGETEDQESQYWMMRQDPKTFIMSLLDWSSKLTKNKTSWIVASGPTPGGSGPRDVTIKIEESHNSSLNGPGGKPLIIRYGGTPKQQAADIVRWEILSDNFLSVISNKLLTSGMSAISGEYLDKVFDEDEEFVIVNDKNTEKKTTVDIDGNQSFSKSSKEDRGWTAIHAVPEFSAGELGVKYKEWVDGRARQSYINMLNFVMRMKVTIRGEPRLGDPVELGRIKTSLRWYDGDDKDEPRFMHGEWLIYGWHHKLYGGEWYTDVYMGRLDHDAKGTPS